VTSRRARGEGGLHWDESRQRWIATAQLGFDARGKRITRKASGITKTAAKAKLREILRDHADGLTVTGTETVEGAVRDWLTYGLVERSEDTVANYANLAENRIIAPLGRRRLRDLSADDVDRWLAAQAKEVSTRTLHLLHSIFSRAVMRAMARDKVKRNVVALCTVPTGQAGRPSSSLTLHQAAALLTAAEDSPLHAYIVLSLLSGVRTEEARALRWRDVVLLGDPDATPPLPPSVSVLRSVRQSGDTKTPKSRRRLAIAAPIVDALTAHRAALDHEPPPDELVFGTRNGTEMDRHNVLRAFRPVVRDAGLDPNAWTPRELRHTFVSLLSQSGVRIEDIARLVGHSSTAVTERVYRHELRPVLQEGAATMDNLFRKRPEA
jgi:integrase